MTHGDRIQKMLVDTLNKGENHWGARHCAAWREPQPVEAGVVGLILSAALYADYYYSRYETRIGEDGFLGEHFASIIKATRALLNGECGRLDCGTVDGLLCDMLQAEGIEE